MRIQHNIMAMNAYRNYNTNTKALSGNLEKLSSGYKINRAGDDAAGLAISEKMRAQITGLDAAQKNVKDGISLVKTAEGAMQEIQDMLNRMDYLATQSANGTYDNEVDRANLQKEVDALKTEINRIADSANFNGIQLLDGSMDSSIKSNNVKDVELTPVEDGQLGKDPQAGIYTIDLSNTTISVDGANKGVVDFEIFGQQLTLKDLKDGEYSGEQIASAIAKAWNDDKLASKNWEQDFGFTLKAEANGSTVTFTMDQAPTKFWDGAVDATNGQGGKASTGKFTFIDATGNNGEEVTVTTKQEAVDSSMGRLYGQAQFALDEKLVGDGKTLTIGDETYVFAVGSGSKYKGVANVIDLTDKTASSDDLIKTAVERLTAAAAGNTRFKVGSYRNDTITITEKEGGVDYTKNNLAGEDGKGTNGGTTIDGAADDLDATANDWAGLVKTGTAAPSVTQNGLTLQIGDTAASYNQMKVSIGDMHTKALGIDGINIGNQTGAAEAIQTIRDAINQVSSVRGDLGAIQNRLDHTGNNLAVMAENIQDAESTIRDTDVADEMMKYVKNNILVQSAQAMLAQANQVPQGVLQLLG